MSEKTVFGKCIKIQEKEITLTLDSGKELIFTTDEPEYFKLNENYEIKSEMVQFFNSFPLRELHNHKPNTSHKN